MTDAPVQLRKILGRRDVLAIAFGAMVGWSWVVLAGEMILRAGTLGSILAFGIGAVMVWLVGLTYAELTAALSRAGGELSFTFVAVGPTGAFVCGWTLVLAYVAVCAFEAVALPTVVSYLAPGFETGYLYTIAGWDVNLTWVLVGGMLPPLFARLHPRYESPVAVVVALTAVMAVAPFFGRPALVWLVDAGSLATVVAYMLVAVSFIVIRRRHPGLRRPYRTPAQSVVGWLAVTTTVFFILLYMPGSPSALVWPEEWAIVLVWGGLGAVLALGMRRRVAALGIRRQARLILGDYVKELGL